MAKTKQVSRKRLAPSNNSSQGNNPKKPRKQEAASSTSSIKLIASQNLKRYRRRQRAHLRRQDAVDLEEEDDRSVGQLAQAQEVERAVEEEVPEEVVEEPHDEDQYFHTSYGGRSNQERNQRIESWINNVSGPQCDNEEEYAERVGSTRRNTSSHAEQVRAPNNDNDENHDAVPHQFLDPIMADLMRDPVFLPTSGTTIDRSTIVMILQYSGPRDPISGAFLRAEDVIPNAALKSAIDMFLARGKKPELRPSRRHLFERSGRDEKGAAEMDPSRLRHFDDAKPDDTPYPQRTKRHARSEEEEEQVVKSSEDSVILVGSRKVHGEGRRMSHDNKAFLGRRRGPAEPDPTSEGMHAWVPHQFDDKRAGEHRKTTHASTVARPKTRYNGFTHTNPRHRVVSSIERLSNSNCNDPKCGCRHPRPLSSGHSETGSYDDRDYFSEQKYDLNYDGSHSEVFPCENPAFQCHRWRQFAVTEDQSDGVSCDSYDSCRSYGSYYSYHSHHDVSQQSHCSLCKDLAAVDERSRCFWVTCPCHEAQEVSSALSDSQLSSCHRPDCSDCHPEKFYKRSLPKRESAKPSYHDRDRFPLQASYLASFPEAYHKRKILRYGEGERHDRDFFEKQAEYLDYGEDVEPWGSMRKRAKVAVEDNTGEESAEGASSVDKEAEAAGEDDEAEHAEHKDKDPKGNSESGSTPALINEDTGAGTSHNASTLPQTQRRRAGITLIPRGGYPDLPFSGRETRQTAAAAWVRNAPLEPGQG